MTAEEHLRVVDFIIKKVNGRVPVIAGTGSNDTAFCVELSQEAKQLGADGLLLVTPYYNKTSQKGLVESFDYIADTVKMPCILYNVPSRTGCNIQIETYCELAKNPYVVAVKEASGNAALAARIVAQCGDNLTVYSGEDNMTLSLMALGGKGVISVFSNALPRQMHDLAAAMLNGDLDTARALNNQYLDLMDGFFLDVNPIPIKEALYQMGLIGSNFCRPAPDHHDRGRGGETHRPAEKAPAGVRPGARGMKKRKDGSHDGAYFVRLRGKDGRRGAQLRGGPAGL